ncbi:aspartate-semialdehyde dehydrogenase [Pseudomonas citronellolis]|uniref:aspartate-semialdehyde dehydrogenase n=1 Tax=Pseudomonas citronellolis TaxID=53408 RepID=UPI0023E4469D|nr:aspartate-semialdehyde dehydrogenase [Pseudomonas citronellolis]MDF3934639.1 aspartate-semialdehyde dehydrogenase [Pseudomonas citronellolis]
MSVDVAVVGATGLVGEALVELLEEMDCPVAELHVLASGESAGKSVPFRGRNLRVRDLDGSSFAQVKLALFATSAEVAGEHASRALAEGCTVIDLSGSVNGPLLLEGLNREALDGLSFPALLRAPGAAAAEVAEVVAALRSCVQVRELSLTACLSASQLGREGVQELARQTAELLNARPVEARLVDRQYAFNMLGQVGIVDASGYSAIERRLHKELGELLPELQGRAQVDCLLAPVFFGDALNLNLRAAAPIDLEQVRQALEAAEGIELLEDDYPTVIGDALGQDAIHVGRVRQSQSDANALNLWIASDNVRKGLGLNAVNLAALLIKHYL